MSYLVFLITILMLLVAFTLKNWLEIRNFRKLNENWTQRVNSLPWMDEYPKNISMTIRTFVTIAILADKTVSVSCSTL